MEINLPVPQHPFGVHVDFHIEQPICNTINLYIRNQACYFLQLYSNIGPPNSQEQYQVTTPRQVGRDPFFNQAEDVISS